MRAVWLDRESIDQGDLDISQLEQAFDSLIDYGNTTPEKTLERIQGVDTIITNKVALSATILEKASSLRQILVTATGLDHIDTDWCKKNNIKVIHATNYGSETVAQHTMMLVLMLARNQKHYLAEVSQGAWSRHEQFSIFDKPIINLAQQTLAVVGFGPIGQEVTRLAKCFGMKVMVSERPGNRLCRDGRVLFETCLQQADFISLHCPLTSETNKMINAKTLSMMKSTACLINTARGGLVDEDALKMALENKIIRGAALDVLSQEPPSAGHPLLALSHDALIITPHQAWASLDARQNIIDQLVARLK